MSPRKEPLRQVDRVRGENPFYEGRGWRTVSPANLWGDVVDRSQGEAPIEEPGSPDPQGAPEEIRASSPSQDLERQAVEADRKRAEAMERRLREKAKEDKDAEIEKKIDTKIAAGFADLKKFIVENLKK